MRYPAIRRWAHCGHTDRPLLSTAWHQHPHSGRQSGGPGHPNYCQRVKLLLHQKTTSSHSYRAHCGELITFQHLVVLVTWFSIFSPCENNFCSWVMDLDVFYTVACTFLPLICKHANAIASEGQERAITLKISIACPSACTNITVSYVEFYRMTIVFT